MRALVPLSLRSRFLLLVLLGAVIPLGLVGYWLSRSARQSGERLVRERLEASLLDVVNSVGGQWGSHRSSLLDLAENGRLHVEANDRELRVRGVAVDAASVGKVLRAAVDAANAIRW